MAKKSMALCLILALFLCVGCAAKSQDAAASESYSAGLSAPQAPMAAPAASAAPVTYATDMEMAMEMKGDGGVYAAENGAAAADQYGGHKVIATYHLELQTDDFDTHHAMLLAKAQELGGYAQDVSVSGTKPQTYHDWGRNANFTFRIPSDKVEKFVDYAGGTGEVTYSSKTTEDVTLAYYDSETRLAVLETQLERLQSILTESQTLADIIELERAIGEVTIEIEQMTTQLRRYDDLIDYSTVTIYMAEERLTTGPAATKTVGERISDGFTSNLSGVGVFFEDAFVWFISSLPVLVLLAVAALALWLLIRLLFRRIRRPRAAKAALPQNIQEENHEASKKK